MPGLQTIVETQAFTREAGSILDEDEIEALKDFLSENPEAGVVIPNSSGVRKLRWGVEGRGKRGGARVIYYYYNSDAPLFLISIFVKAQRTDLDPQELKAAKQFAEAVAREHRK